MLYLLLVGRKMKRKQKNKAARGFFPRASARYTLLAVPGRLFVAVRCN
jgi:hypothetical protein